MKFVKWPSLRVWHIERKDRHTVCGLPTFSGGVKVVLTRSTLRAGQDRLCRSCDRMKSSLPLAEVSP